MIQISCKFIFSIKTKQKIKKIVLVPLVVFKYLRLKKSKQ